MPSNTMRTICGRKPTALLLALLLALAQHPASFATAQVLGGPLGNGPLADFFSGLSAPSLFQQRLMDLPSIVNRSTTTTTASGTTTTTTTSLPGPGAFLGFLADLPPGLPAGLPTPLQDLVKPPPRTTSVLTDIMAPVPRNAAAAAAAAQGVVGSSLLTAAGVCIAVAGGLGSGYAGLSEALGLVTGVAGRINLGMEYAKAGLSLHADVVAARREYVKAFTQASGAVPNVVEQAAQIRKILTTGSFLPQLQALRSQLLTVRGNLDNIKNAATAAAAAVGK